MENRQQIIQRVLDSLWSASSDLMTLSMGEHGPKAERWSEIAGQLQALQADIATSAS
ncbi:hypothetical protein [Achromobacter spanius]|uniref:hypothetical protein n=1 Tax=Achromobacter spanius TaxID=217203 RepID=UPI003802197B